MGWIKSLYTNVAYIEGRLTFSVAVQCADDFPLWVDLDSTDRTYLKRKLDMDIFLTPARR